MLLSRTVWLDWYVEDGESAVLVAGQVVVLSELATALVGAVTDATSVEDVTRALTDTFGAPEGVSPLDATLAAARDLAEHGVLVLDESA